MICTLPVTLHNFKKMPTGNATVLKKEAGAEVRLVLKKKNVVGVFFFEVELPADLVDGYNSFGVDIRKEFSKWPFQAARHGTSDALSIFFTAKERVKQMQLVHNQSLQLSQV